MLTGGVSLRRTATETGIALKTLRKMKRFSAPPGYRREKQYQRPKLGQWLGVIDQIVDEAIISVFVYYVLLFGFSFGVVFI